MRAGQRLDTTDRGGTLRLTSDGSGVQLPGTHPHGAFHRGDPELAIAYRAGAGGLDDGIQQDAGILFVNHDVQADLAGVSDDLDAG